MTRGTSDAVTVANIISPAARGVSLSTSSTRGRALVSTRRLLAVQLMLLSSLGSAYVTRNSLSKSNGKVKGQVNKRAVYIGFVLALFPLSVCNMYRIGIYTFIVLFVS